MKLCMLSTFPPKKCGIGDYTAELCDALTREEVDVHVLTYSDFGGEAFEDREGVKVHRELRFGEWGRMVWHRIKRLSPDIIHLQSSTFLHGRLTNTFVHFKDETPLISAVHDAPGSIRLFHVRPFLKPVYVLSRKLIVHSGTVKNVLEKVGIESSKMVEIPLGVDTKRYGPEIEGDDFRKKYRVDGFEILYFGFLRPGKGIECLIDGFRVALPEMPDARLVVAGDVPPKGMRYSFGLRSESNYMNILKKRVKALGLEEKVIFTGYVADAEMPACIGSADVIVLPYKTSQSRALYLAMAAGRAIITTDMGVIKDEDDGLLISPKSPAEISLSLIKLYKDRELLKSLSRRARKKAENFSWDIIAKRTVTLYEELIQ